VRRAVADNVVAVVYRAARLGQMGSAGERDLQLDAQALEFGNDWGADTLAQVCVGIRGAQDTIWVLDGYFRALPDGAGGDGVVYQR
jgi:hypothetical protein